MDKRTATRIGKYQKRQEESAEQRQAREDRLSMVMTVAAIAFLLIVEAADWLIRIII